MLNVPGNYIRELVLWECDEPVKLHCRILSFERRSIVFNLNAQCMFRLIAWSIFVYDNERYSEG